MTKKDWYKLGDQNTNYFHTCASQIRRTNKILTIRDANGAAVSSPDEIEEVFHRHFLQLLPLKKDLTNGTRYMLKKVSNEMNSTLTTK